MVGWRLVYDLHVEPGCITFDQAVKRLHVVVSESILENEVSKFLWQLGEERAFVLSPDEFVFNVPC